MRLSRCSFHSCKYFWGSILHWGPLPIALCEMWEPSATHQTEGDREKVSLWTQSTKTSLTVTIFYHNLDPDSKSHLVGLKQQRNVWKASTPTLTWGRLPLQGIKTLWEPPSATLQLKRAPKQHPAQFKLHGCHGCLPPPPPTRSPFHTQWSQCLSQFLTPPLPP